MKLVKSLLAVSIAAAAFGAQAATNLVANGSFETGTLAGWNVSGTASVPGVAVQALNAASFYGETVNAQDAAAGTKAVYFVSDKSSQTLSQSVYLAAGTYNIGFSAYAPLNGIANAGAATFTGSIAGVTLANYSVTSGGVWNNYSGTQTITSAGHYDVAFTFNTTGGASKDIVIDSVYVVAAPVPEPETYAMMLAGLGLMGAIARRRKSKAA